MARAVTAVAAAAGRGAWRLVMLDRIRPFLFLLACSLAACTAGGAPPGDDDFTDPGDDGDDGDDGVDPIECESEVIPPPTTAACAAATSTCMEACADEACYESCLAADPAPDACGLCLEDGFLACANAAGCQTAFDAAMCCYEQCADPESAACDQSCSADWSAYEACVEPHDETCSTQVESVCFSST
jgi:hypothetical protein